MPSILLVEDDEMSRDMLSRRLMKSGYSVVLAECGAEGVATAIAEQPDLILMDLRMPDVDGLEATSRIKAEPTTSRIPVVLLTAEALTGTRERALEAGCDDYAVKPVDLKQLLITIERLLSGQQGEGGPSDVS